MKIEKAGQPVAIALCAAMLFQASCKPKSREPEPPEPPASNPATPQSAPRGGAASQRSPQTVEERIQARHTWTLSALRSGYQASGQASPNWDREVLAAFEALVDVKFSRTSTTAAEKFADALSRVAETGCNDPMIQFLQAVCKHGSASPAEAATHFVQVHDSMSGSQYHPLFKFETGVEAVNHLRSADKESDRSGRITRTTISLMEAVRDTNAPSEEICEAVTKWLKHSSTPAWIAYVMDRIGPDLESGWSETEILPLIKGRGAIRAAWADRGSDFADKVTAQGWKGFEANLAKAEGFLTEAWSKNPNNPETAYLMMLVELGQGRGLSRMELWFDRAMQLDPDNYDAARQMSYYLQPRWYGSDETALAFARTCVSSTNWGGRVPLVLADLHRSLARYHHGTNQQAYWQQPKVWPDLEASWDKFFAINSDAAGWRQDYARDAYRCGQYTAFLEQVAQFANRTNHAFFGGETAFRDMLETATAATKNPKRAD